MRTSATEDFYKLYAKIDDDLKEGETYYV